MKKYFFKRAGQFTALNAVLIGLSALVTKCSLDSCIILCCLFCIVIGLPIEFLIADKESRRPDIAEGWGAAIFGSIVAGFIIYGIHLIF